MLPPTGRRSLLQLANRMRDNFCAGVCASTVRMWNKLHVASLGDDIKVMTRKSLDIPGEPPGVILCAATSVWMPVMHQQLFSFLRDERQRTKWDVLSNGGPMQEMIHIPKGQSSSNCVSILRPNVGWRLTLSESTILQFPWLWLFITFRCLFHVVCFFSSCVFAGY